MQGRLFTLLGVGFPSYFVLLLTGFILATAIGAIWAKRVGQDPDVVVDLGLAMLLAGVVGARLLHVVADGYFWDYVHLCTDVSKVSWQITQAECNAAPSSIGCGLDSFLGCGEAARSTGVWDAARNVCHPHPPVTAGDRVNNCLSWAMFWNGGLAYYGGFIGASAAAWYLLKRDRFPFWRAADMAGMVVPLGLGFGRMGCLLAGCCFGKPWNSSLALEFPPRSPAAQAQFKAHLLPSPLEPSLPVHPTQVYEALASLAIAGFLLFWLHGRKRYDGHVFVAFVALYALARFVLEFWRADDRGSLLGLSTSQLIGVALIAAAIALHRQRLVRPALAGAT
jgi:phosphatidylglycerol---prolipoprotein diacylglyceryl transferase